MIWPLPKETYNKNNPFGAFPQWEFYPKTGTHIGSDFVNAVGTAIKAPIGGDMFKTFTDHAKGNVGVFVFRDNDSLLWGLELCHLRELPPLGTFVQGNIIGYTGNTGAATTGAHCHMVMHKDAKVTVHYQLLTSRAEFLKMQINGDLVDPYAYFMLHIENRPK